MKVKALVTWILLGTLSAAFLFVGAGQAAASGSGADQAVAYQINVAHNGDLSGDALNPPLTKIWSRNLGGTVSYPLIAGGRVFVTVTVPNAYGATLYALDESTGATLWSQSVSGTYSFANAAYDNGAIFVVNYNGMLRSYDAATGAPGWWTQLPNQWAFTSAPVANNGTVYVGGAGSGGTLYAVSESTGGILWTASVMNGDHSSPALSDTSVYVSYACAQTYDFDRSSGALNWHYNSYCEGGGGKTPVLSGANLYVRDSIFCGTACVFDAASGQLTRTFNAGPAPAFAGSTAFALNGSTLQAQDLAGNLLWSFTGDGSLDTAPIIVNNDVYVGSSTGNLYALDTSSGQAVWSTNVGASIEAPDEQNATLLTGLGAGEGTLVVPASNTVSAFRPKTISATGVPFSATEGSSFAGVVATFTDSSASAGNETASIAWGDGTTSSGTVAPNGTGGYTVSGAHTYAEEGTDAVGVTVSNGIDSSTVGSTATVSDAPLTSNGYSSQSTAATSAAVRVASFQDADASCAAGDYTATINWGDGSGSTGTVSPSSGACAFDVSGNHTYVVPGSYTVVATVTDAGGSSTSATGGMTVATPVTTSKASVSASNNTNGYVLGLSASVKNSVVSGSMRYDVPTATNPTTHITSTQVTSIVRTGANTATVYGTGTQNGVTVNFAADVFGNQRSGNTFRVRTSALYDSGVLPVSSAKVS